MNMFLIYEYMEMNMEMFAPYILNSSHIMPPKTKMHLKKGNNFHSEIASEFQK